MTQTTERSSLKQGGGAVPLEMFTDEEMAILGGPDSIVVTPFLNRVSDEQRPAVDRTAFRGLMARGILDPPNAEALKKAPKAGSRNMSAIELPVREDVRAMVTLRAAAQAVVAVARTTATDQDFWYAHVIADTCLLEQVGSDGMHRFALLAAAELPDAVVAAALHPEAGDATGEPVEIDPSPDAELPPRIVDSLGEALVRADIVIRAAGDEHPELLGVFTGPEASWSFRCLYGSGDPVTAAPHQASDLQKEIGRSVIETLERARRRATKGGRA